MTLGTRISSARGRAPLTLIRGTYTFACIQAHRFARCLRDDCAQFRLRTTARARTSRLPVQSLPSPPVR